MYSKFESLPKDKQSRIIDACIEEFSQNGYINSSTNSIIKKAEISKGILFHYFGSKKKLYLYILNYCVNLLTDILYDRMGDLPSDFFERVVKSGMLKLKTLYEYPAVYKLIIDVFTNTPEELKSEVQDMYTKLYRDNVPILFKDIDTSKFRDDIDKNKTIELIMFTIDGLSSKYMNSIKNMPSDKLMSDFESFIQKYYEYIDILKKMVYK